MVPSASKNSKNETTGSAPHNPFHHPKQVVWELTLKCNLSCIHCGSSAGKARQNELSTKESLKLCDELAELNAEQICLIGGEPFLHKDWDKIGEKITDLGLKLLIISNGYITKKDIISKLSSLEPYSITISLDGATPQTHDHIRGVSGSFDHATQFISACEQAELPLTVITTVNKLNFHELPKLKDFLLERDIAWQIQAAAPEGRFSRHLALTKNEFYSVGLFIASLQNQYTKKELPVIGAHCFGYNSRCIPLLGLYEKWNGCQAGISIVSIKSNGDVIGCLSLPDEYIEGNIRNQSLTTIWNNPNNFAYNRQYTPQDLGNNCTNCPYAPTCKGGCMGMSTAFTNQPHNDPYCFYKIEENLIDQTK